MFALWTMKSSQDHVKSMIGCWTHSASIHTKEKNIRVIMGFEVPKRHILRRTLFINTVQHVLWWERQKRWVGKIRQRPMAEKWCYNGYLMIFFEKWREMKTREWSTLILFYFNFQNCPCWTYVTKISTNSFFGAWSFLFIHIWFTPIEGPKALYICFLKILDHGSWTMNQTMEKGHLPWSDLTAHGVNRPLVVAFM